MPKSRKQTSFKARTYKNYNEKDFINEFKLIDWKSRLEGADNMAEAWIDLEGFTHGILNKTCPIKSIRIKIAQEILMTPELLHSIKRKDIVLKQAIKTGDMADWSLAKLLRNRIKNKNLQSKIRLLHKLVRKK